MSINRNGSPTLSLIIVCYNQGRQLGLILKAISSQSVKPDEILVADDGSSENIQAVIATWRHKLSMPIVFLTKPRTGFHKTVILNAAFHKLRYDYVVIIDADCVPAPKFFEQHLRLAQRGFYVQGERCRIYQPYSEASKFDKANLFWWRVLGRMERALWYLPWPFPFIKVFEVGNATKSCNWGLWRSDILRIGGMDESFKGWGYEDNDFTYRLSRTQVRCRYVRGWAFVYHLDHPETFREGESENLERLAETKASNRILPIRGMYH